MTLIAPGSTIGIVGGGQLGRMLAMAAANLGYQTHIFSPEPHAPAAQVSNHMTTAHYTDISAMQRFAKSVDVITFEFENVPSGSLSQISGVTPIHPSPRVLAITQNRLREKNFVQQLGIATAPFQRVTSADELTAALATIAPPCILKTTELGYDGKGQVKITDAAEAAKAWEGLKTTEAILEGFIDFDKEISVIVARNESGEIACFPPVHNIHRDHILHQTVAPAQIAPELAQKAEEIAIKIASGLNLIGLLAIEMFVTPGGEILVNELAPRPHNSGHWTMDACTTSQFEQCVRAVCGLPLGSTKPICAAVMTNLIGEEAENWLDHLRNPHAKLHLYGKAQARPGRKMGHVTVLGE